jgi:hypothetical protein
MIAHSSNRIVNKVTIVLVNIGHNHGQVTPPIVPLRFANALYEIKIRILNNFIFYS